MDATIIVQFLLKAGRLFGYSSKQVEMISLIHPHSQQLDIPNAQVKLHDSSAKEAHVTTLLLLESNINSSL